MPLMASEETVSETVAEEGQKHEGHKAVKHGFDPDNPGEFIFAHIKDAHDWHVADIGGKPISIPLPIIVYSNHSGLHCFMSNKFHHGTESYNGFILDEKKVIRELGSGGKVLSEKPLDLSITKNVASMLCGAIILLLIFISAGRAAKRNPLSAPRGMLAFLEPLVLFIKEDVAMPNIGEKKHERYLPYLITVFFFIFINNLLGIIPFPPGGANYTGNISVTMTLALITLVLILQGSTRNYWTHIFNTPGSPWWLKLPVPLMPLIEIAGIIAKPFALMIRLFANITAGHIIILSLISLIFIFKSIYISPVSVLFALFIDVLELLVAILQAYIFTILSALFIGMAVQEDHH